jgi:DNA-binding NarL/FixJ family response regulator
MPNKSLRILVADDHEVVREGTSMLIQREPEWTICGKARDGKETVQLAQQLKPDVIVLDMTMPDMTGLEIVRQLRTNLPTTEILIFTAHRSEKIIRDAYEAGVKSYIRKTDSTVDLVAAIRSVADHKPYFTPEVSEVLFGGLVAPTAAGQKLTAREQPVVRLLAAGRSNKEIAAALHISIRTVEVHRAAVMRKLGVDSLAALVRYAIRNGVIEA